MVSKKSLSILIVLALMFLLVPTVLAADFDNIKSSIDTKGQAYTIGETFLPYNELWEKYKPIEVKNMFGLGSTLMKGAITQHDEVCGIDCQSTMQIYLAEDSVLIDDVDFYTILDDGSRINQDVRSYQFYANGLPYELGTMVPEGTYEVKLDGQKSPKRTVDWVIKTQGETLESWATWGNISSGDDAEVVLNSPVDNYISSTFDVVFNASVNITGGSNIVNTSLWKIRIPQITL